jgi:hypothetical protein
MEIQKLVQTLAKAFGPEFHTTYGGGKRAMAEVLADRYRVDTEQAVAWVDELEAANAITWHGEEEVGLSDEATLRAAHVGQAPSIPFEQDGYWELA